MGTHRKKSRGTERIQEESHPVCGDAMGRTDTVLHKVEKVNESEIEKENTKRRYYSANAHIKLNYLRNLTV